MSLRFFLAIPPVAAALFVSSSVGAKEPVTRLTEVIANADLTEDGKKFPTPTPGHPIYYVPIIYGWHEEGRIVAGEEPPKRTEMIRLLGQALAREGYVLQALRPDANTTRPSIIVAVEWGYLNPVITNEGALNVTTGSGGSLSPQEIRDDPTQRDSTFHNEREMATLVAGSALQRQAFFSEADWQKLNNAMSEGRYYIVVSGYDFEASLHGEQKLLWRTRVSTPRQGVWMSDVMPALVAGGAPLFGRQSDVPKWTDLRVRDGKVIMPDAVVIEPDVKLPASEKKAVDKTETTDAGKK